MKKIILFLVCFLTFSMVFAQKKIIFRYECTANTSIIPLSGYEYSSSNRYDEFFTTDSLFYKSIKNRVDALVFCSDSIPCPYPNVRQQIIVVDGEKYDILSSSGSFAMEKNGRSVIYDKILQKEIYRIIRIHDPSYNIYELPDPYGGEPIRGRIERD